MLVTSDLGLLKTWARRARLYSYECPMLEVTLSLKTYSVFAETGAVHCVSPQPANAITCHCISCQ